MRILGVPIEQWTAATNVILTFGLLLFAGMQWWVTYKGERTRRLERAHDEALAAENSERDQDRAFQTVWAEHFRLDGLAVSWERQALVLLSALGVLHPADLLPKDWTTIVEALGLLGRESGFLGGIALTLAHDTEREVATLNAVVNGFTRKYSEQSPGEIAQLVRHHRREEVAELEARIRRMVRDLSNMLWDAARQSPRADVERVLNFKDDMHSEFARRAAAGLQSRQQQRLVPNSPQSKPPSA
jgi:hypothetical protein